MTTIRTANSLTTREICGLERHGYEILAIETHEKNARMEETFIWRRADGLGIPEYALHC